MLRTTTCLAAFAALIAPAALAESKAYDAQSFSEIKANAAMNVIYERSATPSITVEQDEGDFSDVYLEFEGDTLIISRNSLQKKQNWLGGSSINISNHGKVIKVNGKRVPYYTVRITGPDLDAARVSSSAKLTASGIQSDDFEGKASSSGDLILSGTATRAKLQASSSGDLDANGFEAGELDVHASSSGDLKARSTGTGKVRIEASSSGEVEVKSYGAAVFTVDASSSGEVFLEGACMTIEIDASSSADVDAQELTCRTADVSASSSGDVSVFASESVQARASSSGDINVHGNPTTRDVSHSSGGDVDFSN